MNGLMAECSRDNGRIIKCMVMASTLGKTDDAMKGIMIKTRSMALEFTFGLTAGNTKGIGTMESNMDRVDIFCLMALLKLESGRRDSGKSG